MSGSPLSERCDTFRGVPGSDLPRHVERLPSTHYRHSRQTVLILGLCRRLEARHPFVDPGKRRFQRWSEIAADSSCTCRVAAPGHDWLLRRCRASSEQPLIANIQVSYSAIRASAVPPSTMDPAIVASGVDLIFDRRAHPWLDQPRQPARPWGWRAPRFRASTWKPDSEILKLLSSLLQEAGLLACTRRMRAAITEAPTSSSSLGSVRTGPSKRPLRELLRTRLFGLN
jgi:hypothetical protein